MSETAQELEHGGPVPSGVVDTMEADPRLPLWGVRQNALFPGQLRVLRRRAAGERTFSRMWKFIATTVDPVSVLRRRPSPSPGAHTLHATIQWKADLGTTSCHPWAPLIVFPPILFLAPPLLEFPLTAVLYLGMTIRPPWP